MHITIRWTIIKAEQCSENFIWIQFPHINPVYAMGGGKSGPSLLFYFDQFFFYSCLYTVQNYLWHGNILFGE